MNAQIMTTATFVLYYLAWEESEKGWGTRPDGFSLHVSEEDGRKYVKAYNDSLPSAVADTYSRPATGTYHIVEVSESLQAYAMTKLDRSVRMSDINTNDFRATLREFDAMAWVRRDIEQLTKTVEEGLRAHEERHRLQTTFAKFLK